jgi:hypothetical protein
MNNPFVINETKEFPQNMSNELGKKTKAFENKTVESIVPRHIETINQQYEGTVHPETDVSFKKHTFKLENGEKVEGVFPVFSSKAEVNLPTDLRLQGDVAQFKYCTEQLAKKIETNPELAKQFTPRQLEQIKNGAPRISGLTWHHNEIPGKMQLVDANEHAKTGHTGGRTLWGGGQDSR